MRRNRYTIISASWRGAGEDTFRSLGAARGDLWVPEDPKIRVARAKFCFSDLDEGSVLHNRYAKDGKIDLQMGLEEADELQIFYGVLSPVKMLDQTAEADVRGSLDDLTIPEVEREEEE